MLNTFIEESIQMLKKAPVVKNILSYSKLTNNIAMQRSNEMARLVKNIRKQNR